MNSLKLYKQPLNPGDKFVTIGEWNPFWMGVLEYVNPGEVRMVKPSKPDSHVGIGTIGFSNCTRLEYDGVFWIRYNSPTKKEHLPTWF